MVYFSEARMSPAMIDPIQLGRLFAFRDSLGQRGVLWLSYDDRSSFEQLLRLHLSKLAQDWQARLKKVQVDTRSSAPVAASPTQFSKDDASADLDGDEGLLDLVEMVQEGLETLNEVVARIGHSIEEIGAKLNERTAEVAAARGEGQIDPKKAQRLLARAAEDVEIFAARIDSELPTFARIYERVVNAVLRVALLQRTIPGSDDPVPAAIEAAQSLVDHIRGAQASTVEMRETIASWPRLSRVMNKASRHAVNSLDGLAAEFQRAIDLAEAVKGNLQKED